MVIRLHKPVEGFQTNAILDKQNVHYTDTVLNLSNSATKKKAISGLSKKWNVLSKLCHSLVLNYEKKQAVRSFSKK